MMTRFVFLLIAFLATPAWAQTVYHNRSSVTNQVVIADEFINDGFFEVQNLLPNQNQNTFLTVANTPYDMSGVNSYVNNGVIVGTSIRFENVDDFGQRKPADMFVNSATARIEMADGFHFGNFPILQFFSNRGVWESPFSYVRVDAKNIYNQGLMRIGAGGLMRLGQTNQVDGSLNTDIVDVSSGLLVVDPIGLAYGQLVPTTYDNWVTPGTYLNDLGVYDQGWGLGSYTNMNLSTFVTSFNPTAVNVPLHTINDPFGVRFLTSWSLNDAESWGYTFFSQAPTNIVVQAVYLQTGDTNVTGDVRWVPFAYTFANILTDANNFWTPIVQIRSVTTNVLTLQVETNQFYVVDQLGSVGGTNLFLAQNDRYPSLFRPSSSYVTRNEVFEFQLGSPSNILATPDLYSGSPGFWGNNGFSNVIVTNLWSSYVVDLENLVYTVPTLEDTTVKDLPGRIEINGKNVDLTGAGIRAEGLISLTTDQLVSSDRAILDAQNLAFDLAYTNAAAPATPLRIENLAKSSVGRLRGQIQMWSGVFTNQFGDAQSNVFNVFYHVLVIDARNVTSVQESTVSDFRTRTADLRIQDNMIVSNRFDVNASNVSIAGNVELRNITWGTNLPNLINLTIEPTGSLMLVGLADFGTTEKPLQNFVDQGSVTSYSQSIVADNVDVTGALRSGQNIFTLFFSPFGGLIFTNLFVEDSGPLFITANHSARFTGADVATMGNVTMSGPVFKFDGATVDVGGAISLNVTGALSDSGPNAGNRFSSSNSFSLNTTVAAGSLLGTAIIAEPPPRGTYRFKWSAPTNSDPSITNIPIGSVDAWIAATNRAYSAYATNLGVGRLTLRTGTNTVFEFSGTQRGRALYVDLLEITGTGITNLTSLTNQLRLIANATSSIDIYFADVVATNLQRGVNLGFQNMAEFLNGKQLGGGHLYWIGTYNGANTSEDVVVRGVSVRMNRALRHSQIIDMDLDGIANGNDDLPLQTGVGALAISSINLSQVDGKATVKFTAFQGTYQVQYTDSLQNPVWKTVGNYTNSGSTGVAASVTDANSDTSGPRFYRLIYFPAGGS
jgi:hypothetical protein